MKKFLSILLLCGFMCFMCACTMQEETVADQAGPEPAPTGFDEQVNVTDAVPIPETDAHKTYLSEMPAMEETGTTVPAPAATAETGDGAVTVKWDLNPQDNPNQSAAMQEKEPIIDRPSGAHTVKQVEAVELPDAQEQETAPNKTPPAAPTVLKSTVTSSPAPRQTSAPIPKISVDFVITCPPEPTPTPEMPEPTETPVAQPSTEPVVPEVQQTPAPEQPATPEPTPDPPAPTPTPEPAPTQKPSGGYAVCSCGATILPDELVAHMKAHALKGESHSYVAY